MDYHHNQHLSYSIQQPMYALMSLYKLDLFVTCLYWFIMAMLLTINKHYFYNGHLHHTDYCIGIKSHPYLEFQDQMCWCLCWSILDWSTMELVYQFVHLQPWSCIHHCLSIPMGTCIMASVKKTSLTSSLGKCQHLVWLFKAEFAQQKVFSSFWLTFPSSFTTLYNTSHHHVFDVLS